MKKIISYTVLCTFIIGITSYFMVNPTWQSKNRGPSSEKRTVVELLDEISTRLEEKSTWQDLCNGDLSAYYETFLSMPIEENMGALAERDLDPLVEKSFKTRLMLREKLRDFDINSPGAKECFTQFRALNRGMRYLEDYMLEAKMPSNATATDYTTLTGDGSFYLKNPDFEITDAYSLQSGDIILSRGNAFVSALIARITDIPNQFSHISFVYRDPQGKLWTIESHIEIGAVVAPMVKHVEEKNARTVVYRYKDQKISHAAAEHIFNIVKAQQDTGKNVQYDFGMNLGESKRLFCSEVAYQGFWQTAKISIPKIKNKFHPKLLPFLKRLGFKLDEKSIVDFETFAPGDIEYDTDFSLVAEWRNPVKMRSSRMRDALMSKEVEWMVTKDYTFVAGIKNDLTSYFGWIARRTPFVKKKLEEKFPLNMSPTQLQLNMAVEEASGLIENKLIEVQKASDHQLTYEEMLIALEKIREDDLAIYEKGGKPAFHHRFHPKKVFEQNADDGYRN